MIMNNSKTNTPTKTNSKKIICYSNLATEDGLAEVVEDAEAGHGLALARIDVQLGRNLRPVVAHGLHVAGLQHARRARRQPEAPVLGLVAVAAAHAQPRGLAIAAVLVCELAACVREVEMGLNKNVQFFVYISFFFFWWRWV